MSVSLCTSLIEDGIARLVVNRPLARNALNPAVVFQLQAALRRAVADREVRGIVLCGAGKTFVAGADVAFFLRNLEQHQVQRIVQFTAAGHALLQEIDNCPKPVVACVHGAALGGGLELALACDRIFATPAASLGLPETSIGLYPGMGGTQRLPRRIGVGLAKWLIYTGKILSAPAALAVGLVDLLAPENELLAAARRAIDGGLPPQVAPPRTDDLAALETYFLSHRVDELLAGECVVPQDNRLCGAIRRVRSNAPVALRLAEWLIDEGQRRPPPDAGPLELKHLEELFATRDARHGLAALGHRSPVFQGC